jgi:hypothetical protein
MADATKLVSDALAGTDTLSPEKGSSTTGWCGRTFVLPEKSIGAERIHFLGVAEAESSLGSLDAWKDDFEGPCKRSSFLTFGVALGFAGSLIELAGEVEGVVFHLTGPSAAGKSLAELAALSVGGAASRQHFLTHDNSGRGLEERASKANGRVLVIDELARLGGSHAMQRRRLKQIAHVLAGGQGRVISAAVARDDLKRVNFQIVGMSSGEEPIEGSPPRSEGERTRLIEIEVPDSGKGGIFDCLGPGEHSRRHAEMTERAIRENHGVAFEPFVTALVKDYAAASTRACQLVEEFVRRVSAETPWERRFARKFGLVNAGATMAADFGVAPWTAKSSFKSIRRLYRNARRRVATAEEAADDAVDRLHRWAEDRRKFPIYRKRKLVTDITKHFGFRLRLDGKPVLGVLRSKFPEIVRPSWHEREVLGILNGRGILRPGKAPGRYVRKISVSGLNGRNQHDIVLFRWRALRQAASRVTIELIWPKKANPKRGGCTPSKRVRS